MPDLVTGEAVILDVPIARFPSRVLAIIIDMAIQTLAGIAIVLSLTLITPVLDDAAMAGLVILMIMLIMVGYPTAVETLSRGRSIGKLALGLRVVSDDGGPVRFRQALFRALAAVVELWMLSGAPALISSLLSSRGKRLGDIFAGTVVIQERLAAQGGPPAVMPPYLAGWAAGLELSRLPTDLAVAARGYLARYHEFSPAARDDLGMRLAGEVAARVSPPPPPGVPPGDYLSAVLAERRAREERRLGLRPPPGPPPGPLPGPSPAPPPGAPPPAHHPYGTAPPPPGPPPAPWSPGARPPQPYPTYPGVRPRENETTDRRQDAGGFIPPS